MLTKNRNTKIYIIIMLPVVLFGCERRLRVFENRVLRKIFGPKRDEVTEGWRRLHILGTV
jgi:hypothetical protein